jgi:hypothetical protein
MKVDANKQQYWEGKIAAWLASGLTQRAFCEREHLKRPTFDYWRRRIKPEPTPATAPRAAKERLTLVPVAVQRRGDEAIVLKSPGGWQITLPASIDAALLAAVLAHLA